jgi:hypothetical protein
MFQMMNGERILAQQPLRQLQSISAMEELQCNSAVSWLYSYEIMLANASKRMAGDETINKARALLEIFRKKNQDEKNERV